MDKQIEKFLAQYPFFALIRYSDHEYVCIIQNQDSDIITIYDWNSLRVLDRLEFIELADQWWTESSRLVPINIFLRKDWEKFNYTAKTLVAKEATIIAGHSVKLCDLAAKRTKRKIVTLVRRPT